MNVKLAKDNSLEKVEMRKVFCDTMIEVAKKNEKVVLLDADLMAAMGTKPFQAEFPDRTIDCGIQEANMIGVAAGLSATGFIPFAHTFGPFATRRACDQIFMSCAYAKQNVKIIGSDPGVTAALNGGTHMPFEDLGIMRGIPGMTVIEPADSTVIADMVRKVADIYGMHYIRLVRKNAPKVYEESSTFDIGKAVQIRDGKDVTIIACGICVAEAIKAAAILEQEGITARVLDMFTIKPIDKEAVIAAAKDTGAIVTAENHSINNGLGSAVAEVLGENIPTPIVRIGSQDEFGEVGPVDYLKERFGMTAENIVAAAKKVIAKK